MGVASWLVPMIMSLIGTGVSAATSISSTNKQIAAQEKQFQEQQRLQQEQVNQERFRNQQQQQINNQQMSNQFAAKMNKGYSTGSNQMGAGLGVGVQGLNGNSGYLNEDELLARSGGHFSLLKRGGSNIPSSKVGTNKTTVRDNNHLYFDRIEYAKCGGKFKR
jgi:hypothetical protein